MRPHLVAEWFLDMMIDCHSEAAGRRAADAVPPPISFAQKRESDPVAKRRPAKPTPLDPDAGESRAAVAVTVAWMLLTLSCLAAQVVALVMWLLARSAGIPTGQPNALYLVAATLLFVAMLTGFLVLGLTPLAYRVRQGRPPLGITILAVVIGAAPLITLAVAAIVARLLGEA
jgi:hypothetical protein